MMSKSRCWLKSWQRKIVMELIRRAAKASRKQPTLFLLVSMHGVVRARILGGHSIFLASEKINNRFAFGPGGTVPQSSRVIEDPENPEAHV